MATAAPQLEEDENDEEEAAGSYLTRLQSTQQGLPGPGTQQTTQIGPSGLPLNTQHVPPGPVPSGLQQDPHEPQQNMHQGSSGPFQNVHEALPAEGLEHIPQQVLLELHQQIMQHVSQVPEQNIQLDPPRVQQQLPCSQQVPSSFQQTIQQDTHVPLQQNTQPGPTFQQVQQGLPHVNVQQAGAMPTLQHMPSTMTQSHPVQQMMQPLDQGTGFTGLPHALNGYQSSHSILVPSSEPSGCQPVEVRDYYNVTGNPTINPGGQTNIGNVNVHFSQQMQDAPLDVNRCQKRLKAIYRNKRKGIGFLPGMPKRFDIEEFFVELTLLSEEQRPTKVIRQELNKYTDLLTLKNKRDREEKHVPYLLGVMQVQARPHLCLDLHISGPYKNIKILIKVLQNLIVSYNNSNCCLPLIYASLDQVWILLM
ncbi:uncharacterized protein [Amphiura filiformis]|uniref:uncharacterized protein n=1 Tax=Amphiura filiformis TaxID=82378 RepID=UPI003B2249E8